MSARPSVVAIPSRLVSVGGHTERLAAAALDLADRHYLAAGDAPSPGARASAKGFADGVLAAVAIFVGIEHHQAEALYGMRTGHFIWQDADRPPGYVAPTVPAFAGQLSFADVEPERPVADVAPTEEVA